MCAGRIDDAIAVARRHVEAASPTNQVEERWTRERRLAEIYASAARPREGVALLAKLLRLPSGTTVPALRVDPIWDPLRDDPAFQALLADPKNSAPL
jgi:serine/threonine-protein kinase